MARDSQSGERREECISAEGDEDIVKARQDGRFDRVERKRTMDGETSWQSVGSVHAIERGDGEQFQSSESLIAANRLREEAGYVMDLISVLQSHLGGRRRWAVMQAIRKLRTETGAPVPENFEHAVESAFQQHCLGSGVFNKSKGATKPALFYWPLGKVGGVWAVYPDKAEAWIADRR
jgi:hypothetical protein